MNRWNIGIFKYMLAKPRWINLIRTRTLSYFKCHVHACVVCCIMLAHLLINRVICLKTYTFYKITGNALRNGSWEWHKKQIFTQSMIGIRGMKLYSFYIRHNLGSVRLSTFDRQCLQKISRVLALIFVTVFALGRMMNLSAHTSSYFST